MNNTTSFRGRFAIVSLAFIFASALAGCGGGGGGGGTPSLANSANGLPAAQKTSVGTKVPVAAAADPATGGNSVTQSSTVDGSDLTRDQVETTVTYSDSGVLQVTVANQRDGGVWSVDSNEDLAGQDNDGAYKGRYLEKRDDSGNLLFVDVYTDRQNAADTNYLAGGVWLYIPADGGGAGIEIGAFADGFSGDSSDPTPTSYLTTTATARYAGRATGLYVEEDTEFGEEADTEFGEFDATVTLNASFSENTVSGRIHSFRVNNDPVVGALVLEEARIGSGDGGLFTGATSGSGTLTGKWGGQFFGNEADRVAGTFGASGTDADGDDKLSIVGAYGAYKD